MSINLKILFKFDFLDKNYNMKNNFKVKLKNALYLIIAVLILSIFSNLQIGFHLPSRQTKVENKTERFINKNFTRTPKSINNENK